MGTNYYIDGDEEKHVGKKSSGWAFIFRDRPRYETMLDVWTYLKDKRIVDEYGQEISHDDFWTMVFTGQIEKHVQPALVPAIFSDDYRRMGGFDFCKGEFC